MLKQKYLLLTLSFFYLSLQAETIDEIIVNGDWRESSLSQTGTSLILITDEQIQKLSLIHI